MQCKVNCSCPRTACENHGKCCVCLKKHKNTDSLPFCLFEENTGDKSNKGYYEFLKTRFENKE
ncbi:MAG: hypothetical protein FWE36_07420 [Erysipelotrichales bacterium]|nr:hypothetical protein [Erysipelotrichales bacterium]